MSAHLRELLVTPFKAPEAIDRLGRAIWLYVHLVAIANSSGHICRSLDSLAADLGVSPGQVETWLARLVHAEAVSVHVPAPYLVIKLRFWSTAEEKSTDNASQNSDSHREVPVNSKLQLAAAENNKQASSSEDGGSGEGGTELVAEVLRVLGETDAGEFRELIEQLPRPVVLKALLRVKSTPADQIRKSKAALFRYLLNKFSHESYATTPPHQT